MAAGFPCLVLQESLQISDSLQSQTMRVLKIRVVLYFRVCQESWILSISLLPNPICPQSHDVAERLQGSEKTG